MKFLLNFTTKLIKYNLDFELLPLLKLLLLKFPLSLLATYPSNNIVQLSSQRDILLNRRQISLRYRLHFIQLLSSFPSIFPIPFLLDCLWLRKDFVKSRISYFLDSELQHVFCQSLPILLNKLDDLRESRGQWTSFVRCWWDISKNVEEKPNYS